MTMHRGNHDDPHTVVTEERYIPAKDAGIQLYLRNKRPAGVTAFGAERTVLLVHGSSYPAHTAFDLPLDGMSWMDYMAGRGFDVHCLDLRGFGRSTRPPEMDRAAAAAEPVVDTSTALRDVAAAVEHILESRSIDRLCLIGWSWGATLVGAYTAEHGERVARLVLYAPQWLRDTPHPAGGCTPLGAYRTITVGDARQRWLSGVPEDRRDALVPPAWFDAWASATFASDAGGATQEPPVIRAPNGNIADSMTYWCSGRPLYDPGRIRSPTLVVVGAWDADTPVAMAEQVFRELGAASQRRMVVIGDATHTVLLERNRMQLFRETQLFLEEQG
ncbi:alpha/beta hydrolase [Azospirillum argentinense]|uniref:Alpha/beta hydrolase n=1 Tax=Azospirillum argentinense TaxID=2970906 RepID=A0ABW8VDY2_9PROT